MNNFDTQYINLLQDIIKNGTDKTDRTGTGTRSVSGRMIQHDMSTGFPAVTTKRLYFKTMAIELEGFVKGITDKEWYRSRGCHIWDNWSNKLTIPEELRDNPNAAKLHTDLGPIYGSQWRNFNGEGYDQVQNVLNSLQSKPDDRRMVVSAWNPLQIESMALPPCFTGENMVMTSFGIKKIQDATTNDFVLTEDGSYQKVYDVMKTPYHNKTLHTFKLKYSNEEITCTPNHPFMIKDKGWVEAKDISIDDFFGIPRNKKSIVPEFSIKKKVNQFSFVTETKKLDNKDDWFLMGFFIGDGWLTKEKIFFALNNYDEENILPRLYSVLKISEDDGSHIKSVRKYATKNILWHQILSQFKSGTKNKIIPQFVLDAPTELVNSFIEGYIAADGSSRDNKTFITTISPSLAHGMKLLFAKIGIKASVNLTKKENKRLIQGREVNQNNSYEIYLNNGNKYDNNYYYIDDDYVWYRVDEIKIHNSGKINYVYNLSVENNHTYNVNNFITHNCHVLWQVIIRGDCLDLLWYQRSVDTFIGLPFNVASYGLLLELLAKQFNYKPGILTGFLGDTHLYNNHFKQVETQTARLSQAYDLPTLTIDDSFSDIREFDASLHVKLDGYKYHDPIAADIAV